MRTDDPVVYRQLENAISFAESEAASTPSNSSVSRPGPGLPAPGHPSSGAEVFSLVRDSELGTDEYLDSFFDTGTERSPRENG